MKQPNRRVSDRLATRWARRYRPGLENLEDRTLLSGDLGSASQTLLAPALAQQTIVARSMPTIEQFTVHGPGPTVAAEFDLAATDSNSSPPSSMLLFDGDGNALAIANLGAVTESLSATLQTNHVYELEMIFPSQGPNYTLTSTLGPQALQPTTTIAPFTGVASVPLTTFSSPTDVEYFPLVLTNAGVSGAVTVTPSGDVQAEATLFRRDNAQAPWQTIAQDAQAGPVTLPLTPPPGKNLTDAQYMLAVAPRRFATAAGSFRIDVATTTLASVTVDPTQAINLSAPPPMSLGIAQVQTSGPTGSTGLFKFSAPGDGIATISLAASGYQTVLSAYDATGTQLLPLQVASDLGSGVSTLSLPVADGTAYLLRTQASGATAGTYKLTITTPYLATPLAFDTDNDMTTAGIPALINPGQAALVYRVTPAPNTDVLAVQVTPAADVGVQVMVVGPGGIAASSAAGAMGTAVFLPVALTGVPGPYDVYVTETGDDLVTVRVGQLDVAKQLPLSKLTAAELALDGSLDASAPDNGFGTLTGIKYFQLLTQDTTTSTTVKLEGQGGAQPLLALYRDTGGVFQLAGFQAPDGQATAQLTEQFDDNQLEGVAAYGLDFGNLQGPSFQFHVTAPVPAGEQLSTVPDLTVRPLFQATMNTKSITLQEDYQQQLWQTILPQDQATSYPSNGLSAPTIYFAPLSTTGPVQARISVYLQGNPTPIATGQSNPLDPAAKVMIYLSTDPAFLQQLQGATLLIRVEPLAGKLGSGAYDLSLHVATADPTAFQLNQQAWQFAGPTPAWQDADAPSTATAQDPNYAKDHLDDPGILPTGSAVVDILQNQFGHGEVQGTFTSKTAGTLQSPAPGSIAVYRFWAITPGPVSVKTVAVPGSMVNTDLHVYRATYDKNGAILYLGSIQSVGPSLDWYQADRSQIDAQTFVNDFDVLTSTPYTQQGTNPYGTGGGMYFVVVRNEEGSTGSYDLEVDTASPPLRGDANNLVAAIPTQGGSVALNLPSTQNFIVPTASHGNAVTQDSLAYFPVQLPVGHASTLTVTADKDGTLMEVDLFDANGNFQRPTSVVQNLAIASSWSFPVADGLQTMYVRVLEKVSSYYDVTVRASAAVQLRVVPPSTTLAAGTATQSLSTDPFGNAADKSTHDGRLYDSLKYAGASQAYEFQAPAGAITVNVAPDVAGDISLRWGVYVNNLLVAWGLGGGGDNTFELPALREPGSSTDFDFDTGFDANGNVLPGTYQNVVLRIEALTNPLQTGGFTVTIQTHAVLPVHEQDLVDEPVVLQGGSDVLVTAPAKPMRNADLAIDSLTGAGITTLPIPLAPSGTNTTTTTGLSWVLLSVPDGNLGAVKLTVNAGFAQVGAALRYDLYDTAGQFLATGSATLGLAGKGLNLSSTVKLTLSQVRPGHSYYLRVSLVNAPATQLTMTASAAPKISLLPTPQETILDFLNPQKHLLEQAEPTPDGLFDSTFDTSVLVPFWVGQGGIATFQDIDNPGSNYIALYRVSSIAKEGNEQIFFQYNLQLSAYQNIATGNAFVLSAYLDPGLYVLQGGGLASVFAQLPAFPVTEIILSPSDAHNDAPLDQVDRAAETDHTLMYPLGQSFRTTFYHVEAPLAVIPSDGMTASVAGLSLDESDSFTSAGELTPYGRLMVWTAGDAAPPYLPVPDPNDTYIGSALNDPELAATVTVKPTQPQSQYWLRFDRLDLGGDADVSVQFTIPQSGIPDLVLTDLHLEPDNGMTRVVATVQNHGYADAPATHALYRLTDGQQHTSSSDLQETDLGPSDGQTFNFTFQPDSAADAVKFTANSTESYPEVSCVNNTGPAVLLSSVDQAPTVTVSLADPSMSSSTAVWGRYVSDPGNSGPHSDIVADVEDPAGTLYEVFEKLPAYGIQVGDGLLLLQSISAANKDFLIAKDFQFNELLPTDSGLNPNIVKVWVEDVYGLMSPEVDHQVVVVPMPTWITSLAWDDTNKQYQIGFHKKFIDFNKDLSQILTGNDNAAPDAIPFIGSAQNEFLIELDSDVVAGLDPTVNVNGAMTGQITLTVLNENILNETFSAQEQLTPNISVYVSLVVAGQDLSANALKVSFQFQNLKLFHYETPEIPLFTYGIPGVLNLNLNIKFLIDVMLNAGVSVALPLQGAPVIGLMAPTYVQPDITLGAKLSGAAQILGFDVASIYGEVDFTLTVTVGLNAPANTLVPFLNFFEDPASHLAVSVTGQLGLSFGAEVLGFTVFSYSPTFPTFQIAGTPGVPITTFPELAPPPVYQPAVPMTGSSQLGALVTDPRPNVAVDPNSGAGLYVQVVDATSPGDHRGNLAFATQTAGSTTWSAPVTLDQPENVSNPALALTHDQPGSPTSAPAVVVYQANSTSGINTLDDLLKAQDIRYRYWDGTEWQSEQALTSDSLYDSDPVVSFNNAGMGVAAWTHNVNSMPMTTALDRSSNEIEVAVWDRVHHVFLTPLMLTSATPVANCNSMPAVFAGPGGQLYVTWISTDSNGITTPMTSIYSGGSWSQPQVLQVAGLPAGATLGSLAMGSDGPGRIDVLMTSTVTNPATVPNGDTTVTNTLYNRPSDAVDFLGSTPVETVADGSNFSFLRTTNDDSGALIAYWEQSDGQSNDVYAAVRSDGGAWSPSAALSNDHGLKYAPSLAVDNHGNFETVFETKPPPSTPVTTNLDTPGPADMPTGIAVSSRVGTTFVKPAPELSFSEPLTFAAQPDGASGTPGVGLAQIFNSGLVGTYVTIAFFDGVPGQGGVPVDLMQTIFLGAGHTYDIAHSFAVQPGTVSYSIEVTAVDGSGAPVTGESGTPGTADIAVTTATLVGLPNLIVASMILADPNPIAGKVIQVQVVVQNVSNLPVGDFNVTLYRGDPRFANQLDPVTTISTLFGGPLGPLGSNVLNFYWTVPAGGNYLLTAEVDPQNAIQESTRSDNFAHINLSLLPDLAIVGSRDVTAVTATVLNYSGVNNVRVDTTVSNLGHAAVGAATVILLSSLDDGPYTQVGRTKTRLAAQAQIDLSFITSGLAGHNHYRVVVDPDGLVLDSNRSNNAAETVLVLQEFPDLLVPSMGLVETQTPAQGQPLTVQAVIQNQGIASARAISVEVFAGDPHNNGYPIGQTTLDVLAALSSATVDIAVDTSQLRAFQELWVVVNRLQSFPETSFFNNTAIETYFFYFKDTVPPTSHVLPLPAVTAMPDFLVQWQGQDGPLPGASGLKAFDIYVSVDGGAFSLWLRTAATSATYHGLEGHSYSFFSRATDYAGNVEQGPPPGQAQTTIPPPEAEVHGFVFDDANGNRQLDTGETGLAGWTVYLDLNHDGRLDPGDPVTTSDASGAYTFTGLPAGSYTVVEIPGAGWLETSPGTPVVAEPDPSHFVQTTGPGMHYAWVNHGAVVGNTTTIWYDFRSIGSYANLITPAEMLVAEQALEAWSDASLGRLRFVRNTKASVADIINIGVGDMAAVDGESGPSLVLSRGGAMLGKGGSLALSNGVVWLDAAASWDTIGNPDIAVGTYEFFPVVLHELGLSLGLAESADRTSSDIMYGIYHGDQAALSAGDRADIRALYPIVAPTPGQAASLAIALQPHQVATAEDFGNFLPFEGVQTFAERAGGPGADAGQAVATDAAGNVYVAGEFRGPADFSSPTSSIDLAGFGGNDAFVAKYATSGQLLWVQPLGGADADSADAIAVDAMGNVYVTGSFNGDSGQSSAADVPAQFGSIVLESSQSYGGNAFVVKLDTAGNVLWVQEIDDGIGAGGTGIALDAAGNVYTTGSFVGLADFLGHDVASETGNQSNAFVLKQDTAGHFVWVSQFGKPDGTPGDGVSATAIAVDATGSNIYVGGSFRGTNVDFGTQDVSPHRLNAQGGSDIFVEKLNGQGNYVWAVRAGSATPAGREGLGESANGIALDSHGNVFITGSFDGTANFGLLSATSQGGPNAFLAKLNSTTGAFIRVLGMGSAGLTFANGIAIDSKDNVYITGAFTQTATFGSLTLTSLGDEDVFVVKLDDNLNVHQATDIGGAGRDQGLGIAVDPFGYVDVTGSFDWNGLFPVTPYGLDSAGDTDVFVSRLKLKG